MPTEYVTPPEGSDVLRLLGWPVAAHLTTWAAQHVDSVRLMVRAYTRGQGFAPDTDWPEADIKAVIVSAAARSLSNPSHAKRIEAGSYSEVPGSFNGWSLAELAVLHGYRRRAA